MGWRKHFMAILGIGRTSYYVAPELRREHDTEAVKQLKAANYAHPFYGTRRLAIHLGWNRKKATRIRTPSPRGPAPASARNWKGPYLKKRPVDPWGNPYVYRSPSSHGMDYDLYSYGRNGVEGGGDDITNWEETQAQ